MDLDPSIPQRIVFYWPLKVGEYLHPNVGANRRLAWDLDCYNRGDLIQGVVATKNHEWKHGRSNRGRDGKHLFNLTPPYRYQVYFYVGKSDTVIHDDDFSPEEVEVLLRSFPNPLSLDWLLTHGFRYTLTLWIKKIPLVGVKMSTNYKLVIDGDGVENSVYRSALFDGYQSTLEHTIPVDYFEYDPGDFTFTVKRASGTGSGNVHERLLAVALRYAVEGIKTCIYLDDVYCNTVSPPFHHPLSIRYAGVIRSDALASLGDLLPPPSVSQEALVLVSDEVNLRENVPWFYLITAAKSALGYSGECRISPNVWAPAELRIQMINPQTTIFVTRRLWQLAIQVVGES